MACIEYPLCKYAHYEKDGTILCINGRQCKFQRYCSSLLKYIHTSAYKTCEEASILSGKKKNIVQELSEEKENKHSSDIIEKSEICKVRYDNGLMYIDFKGYGLVTTTKNKKGTDEVTVYYSGEIGEPTFKFWL